MTRDEALETVRRETLKSLAAAHLMYVGALHDQHKRVRTLILFSGLVAACTATLHVFWHDHLAIVLGAAGIGFAAVETLSAVRAALALHRLCTRLLDLDKKFSELEERH